MGLLPLRALLPDAVRRPLARVVHPLREDYRVLHRYAFPPSLASSLSSLRRVVRARCRPTRSVLFYPGDPVRETVAWKLCTYLGVRPTTDPTADVEAAFLWRDRTTVDPAAYPALSGHDRVFNRFCTDISKSTVGARFAETFGYALAVDPARYIGPVVEKSEENATHDGRLRTAPFTDTASGFTYQRFVDNTLSDRLCVDYRVPVVGDTLPLAYLRFRRTDGRFRSAFAHGVLVEIDDVLSADEQERILAFSRRMGLDYGELDVLRDRADGRIYVVDCNKTPWGPTVLPRQQAAEAVARMAPYFDAMLRSYATPTHPQA